MMRIMMFIVFVIGWITPAYAQVAINANQTHTLSWEWNQTEGPITEFVFRCGDLINRIAPGDTRSLRFGSLVDAPGLYTGCTLTAKNDAGSSAPVLLPDFQYAYSYKTLGLFLLECIASVGAAAGVLGVVGRRVLHLTRRQRPLTLEEPVVVLKKERDHVYRA
jgi:hypothetical protein